MASSKYDPAHEDGGGYNLRTSEFSRKTRKITDHFSSSCSQRTSSPIPSVQLSPYFGLQANPTPPVGWRLKKHPRARDLPFSLPCLCRDRCHSLIESRIEHRWTRISKRGHRPRRHDSPYSFHGPHGQDWKCKIGSPGLAPGKREAPAPGVISWWREYRYGIIQFPPALSGGTQRKPRGSIVGFGSRAADWAVSAWRVVYSICSGCLS